MTNKNRFPSSFDENSDAFDCEDDDFSKEDKEDNAANFDENDATDLDALGFPLFADQIGRCDFTSLAKKGDFSKNDAKNNTAENDDSENNGAGKYDSENNGAKSGGNEKLRVLSPEEIEDDILLSTVDGVGPLTTERLVDYFGSATEVLRAPLRELERVVKIGAKMAQKIAKARENCDVETLIRFCCENEIEIISIRDARYPERLREIDNPPRLLYVRGQILAEDRTAIAVVGTRAVTPYGREQTTRLTKELVAAGFTIVSGLALGIDGCAHRAALASNGRTLAVLGGGVAKIYPREHTELARTVAENGAILSEYHPLTAPLAGNFPARNRIVSGLSAGVLVVESPIRGGSLITARIAAEQNREVFAVPGPVDRATSGGCHQLLREGAALVETVDDILEALPPFERPNRNGTGTGTRTAERSARLTRRIDETESGGNAVKNESSRRIATSARRETSSRDSNNISVASDEKAIALPTNLSDEERKIVALLGTEPLAIDAIIRESGVPAAKIVALIAALEFKKLARRREGNAVSRY